MDRPAVIIRRLHAHHLPNAAPHPGRPARQIGIQVGPKRRPWIDGTLALFACTHTCLPSGIP